MSNDKYLNDILKATEETNKNLETITDLLVDPETQESVASMLTCLTEAIERLLVQREEEEECQ